MHTPSDAVIRVENISKTFGPLQAIDRLSFEVYQGEIFGLLGPNGAGKTTTLSIIEGLRDADAGRVVVLGRDMASDAPSIKARIGVQLQSTSLLPDLDAVEQVKLFGRLYGRPVEQGDAQRLLERFNLGDKATARPGKLSGGQKQRLALALALVNDPAIIFLDEPTSGLDPQSRRMLWGFIRELQAQGRTIVLTTHYMEEAEALCHRVGIINRGRLLALDTPGSLINQLGDLSTISTSVPLSLESVGGLAGVVEAQHDGEVIRIQTRDVVATLDAMLVQARQIGASLGDLHIRQPSLEDVFLQLTGHTIRN